LFRKDRETTDPKEAPELLERREDCNGGARIPLLEKVHSFDDLARGLDAGTISRRKAVKLVGGALLGSALIPFFSSPAEARRRKPCRGKADACTSMDPPNCGGNPECFCLRTTGGGKQCVNLEREECPTEDECDSAEDCGRNEVCAVVAGCCEGSPRNLCVRRCR
jgi:hypothetical protein